MAVTLDTAVITADTRELYLRTVEDQVHDRIPLVFKLKRMRRVTTVGGTYISKPLRYAKNTHTQSYATGETLDSGTESKRTRAKIPWAKTQTPIKYTVDDEIENNGEAAIVDTISEETKAAQEDMVDVLSENFFNVYAGTEESHTTMGVKYPLSIKAALIPDETTYHGKLTYGNITRATIANGSGGDWWAGNADDGTLGNPTTVSFNQWDYMTDLCMQHRGNRKSMLAICGSALFRKWKSLVRAKEGELDISGMMAKAGFAAFSIDGVELVLDDNCPASTFYMLDLSTWEWRINPKRNFKVTPFKWQGENNNGIDEYLARVLLAHNLVCWKPRNNYVGTAMS